MKNLTFWGILPFVLWIIFPLSLHSQYQAGKKALQKESYPKSMELFQKAGQKSNVLLYMGMANYFSDLKNPSYDLDSAYALVLLGDAAYASLNTKKKEQARKDLGRDRPLQLRRKIEKVWFTSVMAQRNPDEMRVFLNRVKTALAAQRKAVAAELTKLAIKEYSPEALLDFLDYVEGDFPESSAAVKAELKRLENLENAAFVKKHAPSDEAFLVLQKLLLPDFSVGNWVAVRDTLAQYAPLFAQKNEAFQDLYDRVSQKDRLKKTVPITWEDGKNRSGYAQVLTGDGKQLYFCSSINGSEDIFYARRMDKGWSIPVPVSALNSPKANESVEDISTNGTEMLLFVNGDIFESKKTADGWQKPTPLSKTINTLNWEGDSRYFSGGLIFSSNRNGNFDIFIARYASDGSTLQAPFSIGEIINTEGNERSPFLHPDGKTLYFASDRQGSFGKSDIYISKRLDDTWQNWSTPRNLGLTVNSEGFDWGFIVTTDGKSAYTTSGSGKSSYITYIDLPTLFRPDSVYTFQTKVLDGNGKPVEGEVVIEDVETGEIVQIVRPDPITGAVFIPMAEKKNFRAALRKQDAPPVTLQLDFTKTNVNHIVENTLVSVTTEELKRTGANMRINNLFFETGSNVILAASQLELDALSKYFKDNQLSVEIHGHTDDVGSPESNQLLSENRANAVRKYLIDKGCSPEKIKAIGFGETRPVEPNTNESARQKNRRVEFKLI